MGFNNVYEVLRVGRGEKLEELLDHLRPMPGHRIRLTNFVEEERARAQCAAESVAVGASTASRIPPPPLLPLLSLPLLLLSAGSGAARAATAPRRHIDP